MGVPHLFVKLTKSFPGALERTRPLGTKRLFLDFNCAIHHCREGLVYNGSDDQYEKDLIFRTIEYLKYIIEYASPSDFALISIDGVPPVSKMIQQRSRRFSAAMDRDALGKAWDSNAISPGTPFMTKLRTALLDFIRPFSKIRLSSDLEEGEGEFKIFTYLTQHGGTGKHDVLYGLDNDLIFLGLLQENGLRLLRESSTLQVQASNSKKDGKRAPPKQPQMLGKLPAPSFIVLNLRLLKQSILPKLREYIRGGDISDKQRMQCFVMLCSLLGNDFVPKLSYLEVRDGGMDDLLKAYQQTCTPGFHIIKNDRMNMQFVEELLYLLAQGEDAKFESYEAKYYEQPMAKSRRGAPPLATFTLYPKIIKPGKRGWRKRYYYHLFENANVHQICDNYLEGLEWVFRYYIRQAVDPLWFYRYEYAPTLYDLATHIAGTHGTSGVASSSSASPRMETATSISPELQLLMILPYQSCKLLPDSLQPLVLHSSISYMYPLWCPRHTYLKFFDWQCTPALPPMDISAFRVAFDATLPPSARGVSALGADAAHAHAHTHRD